MKNYPTMDDVETYKFNKLATKNCPIINGRVKEFLHSKYSNPFCFGINNLLDVGMFKLSGWSFDLRPHLKRYVYKSYDSWQECYAPNKTLLRKSIGHKADEIVETPKHQ